MTTTPTYKKSTLSTEAHAVMVTAEWLRNREYIHPSTARATAKATYAHTSGLYRRRLPRDWQLFQEQTAMMATESRPDTHQKVRAGFLALQATMHAREAFVYDAVIHDKDIVTANELSWRALNAYSRSVVDRQTPLPSISRLAVPLDEAVERYTGHEYGNPTHTFIGMVGLSAALISDFYDKQSGRMIVPNPGASLTALHGWDYDPASLAVPMGPRF